LDFKLTANLFLFVVFLYASVGTLIGSGFDKRKWIFYAKPFIMPVLVAYYLLNTQPAHPIIIIAMLCAFLGDFFLMWYEKRTYFLSGLLSFFVMQILYIAFINNNQLAGSILSVPNIIMACMYLLLGTIIFSLLVKHLSNLMIPVIFYILLLLSVSYFCFLNVMEHKTEIAFVQYAGSLLFLISDTLLAFDSFRKPIRFGGIYIMISYIVAQLFLLAGFMNT
jgi:uncharacterized membrane protein YhhN